MNGSSMTMTNPVRSMLLPQQNQLSPFGQYMVERLNVAGNVTANPYQNLPGRNITNICDAEINAAHSAKQADLQTIQDVPTRGWQATQHTPRTTQDIHNPPRGSTADETRQWYENTRVDRNYARALEHFEERYWFIPYRKEVNHALDVVELYINAGLLERGSDTYKTIVTNIMFESFTDGDVMAMDFVQRSQSISQAIAALVIHSSDFQKPRTQLPGGTGNFRLDGVGTGKAGARNPLPHVSQVRVDPRKINDYALNPNNARGAHKARVFDRALGFNRSNSQQLIDQVQQRLPHSEAIMGKLDHDGQRFTVDMPITGPNGNTVMVRTGWIIDPGATVPRMLTIYVR